jgi:hypothetical protein
VTRRSLAIRASTVVLVLVLATALAGSLDPRSRGTAVRVDATYGDMRTLESDFLGVNGVNFRFGREIWSTSAFRRALADLSPPAFRVFGGTTANYWEWRAGEFSDDPQVPANLARYRARNGPLPFETIAAAVKASGASPVFVLNMVTSTLEEQIEMLRRAEELGLAVNRVELGNELAGNETADLYPSGSSYAEVANRWTAALKLQFPEVEVAIAANAPDAEKNVSDRKRTWTPELLAAQRDADAAVFHAYYGLEDGSRCSTVACASVEVLTAPDTRMRQLAHTLGQLPAGMDAWVTEFNLLERSAPVHGTWAQGLALASFILLLASEPRVTHADVHALVGNAVFGALFQNEGALDFGSSDEGGFVGLTSPPPTEPLALGATGVAAREMFAAFRGATSARPIHLVNGPVLNGGQAPAVLGLLLNGVGTRIVLANRSHQAVAVRLPVSLGGRWATTLAALPRRLVNGDSTVPRSDAPVHREVILAPYSVTTIR